MATRPSGQRRRLSRPPILPDHPASSSSLQQSPRRHYVDDALYGYAIGHFVATFVHGAFIEPRWKGAAIGFLPMEEGGVLRLALPFN